MLDRIFKLGKEAAIYGLSSIVGRFLNFLLVPFYTNFLTPDEYGVVGYLYAFIAFAQVIYGYGMDTAYMRFVSTLDIGDKKQNVSVPFFSVVISSVVLSVLIHVSAPSVGALLSVDSNHLVLVKYSAWILFFDTLNIVPFAFLRMENRAKKFAAFRLMNIAVTIALTVVFLVPLGMKMEAVFLANLMASGVTTIALVVMILPQLTLRLPPALYREMLRFGLPIIPAGLGGVAMQVIDRPILMWLTDKDTVGIYTANYRLGVLMMLVVGMFDYAWRPFFLTHARETDAPRLFAKIFTYLTTLLMLVLVIGSLFVEDVVRIRIGHGYFIGAKYWGGLSIVPVVLLAYVFNGAYVNFVAGVYLEKKTKYLPYATGLGALVNVVANILLIPRLGIMGAALATLFSYIAMAAGIYFPSQRLYHVEYEWGRLVRLLVAAGAVIGVFLLLDLQPATSSGVGVKIVLTALFILLVFVLKVFDRSDIEETKEAFSRMFVRS